jgi:cytochrome c oxidase subunit III
LADTHALASEHAAEHSPHLRHHFDDMHQQFDSATFGMWVFLLTEIMFFGAIFGAYTVYRTMYPEAFAATSNFMNPKFGAANTLVLIVSSLTMALAVRASQLGQRKLLQTMLVLTMLFGTAFLVIKGFEYHEHWVDMKVPLFPSHWSWDAKEVGAAAAPYARQAQILFCFYFFMTGFHAVHMLVGLGIMTTILLMARKGTFGPSYYTPVEVSGLYWHFVDIVWIFLFPLLYLIGHTKELV